MASERGPTATEAPRAPSTSTVPQTTAPFGSVAELARSRSLKRQRETTPTSQDPLVPGGDISPSKIARLVGFARQSHNPSVDEIAENEGSRQGADEHQLAQLEHSENQPATDELMSGVAADIHRPQDAPPDTGHSDIEAAAAAATARALSSVAIPTGHVTGDELHDVSPQSGTSGASVEDGDGHVVDSPTAMEVDSRNDEGLYAPQPEAPMEDKTGASLSYPGAMPAPGHSQRMMSMPINGPQTPGLDLTPRSPNSNKKHKCPYCETEFTRHHNLKSHLLTHSQEKPYNCPSCQMRFRRLHDLKRHSKLHTGEKPHVCPSCDRKFARGDALARHSKGAGGCAGRRQTMGSFGLKDGYDGADSSAMSGALYDGGEDMSEDERRRLSMPSIKPQHVAGQTGPEGYGGHSSTYPPAGQRQGAPGGLYPPNVDRGSSTNTSPSMPGGHTPQTSISSVPLSAGSSAMYSQGGMTESPKPLSPGGTQVNSAAGQQRAGNEQQQGAPGLSLPTHGNTTTSQHAAGRERGRAASGAAQRPPQGGENGGFAQPDLWALFQHLEGMVKQLSAQAETDARSRTQLVEKINTHEQHIAALTAEVAALRQQFTPPQEEEGSPADSAAAQQ
ncbi:hypothetical protein CHGG_02842 [Chaetomium globosum CBS 148.51]|uniref:C2H2-type domain-containing protein n=1 Tax=Chaetomium globosum (strain ATCC 6205 / CBS 148.51 / DSM 1962 / NBRC 6347 / NRRL 1970) TaxID=306901 RepID=Q2HAB2_CHAGB|nr:uncharacterized protein CHGG_02842 [Chaetomium globosum CBS 148.51]EAQ90907.1 hypothetical protein CHGG_02842 [Chaetomium globosum CBS 148.51]